MKTLLFKALLATSAAFGLSQAAHAVEILAVDFTRPDGGVSTRQYSGILTIEVSGFGQSKGPLYGDAFYIFPQPLRGHDPDYYQLTFDTNPLVAFNPTRNAKNFILGGLPDFRENNVYRFRIDTGVTTPSFLHFGVGDGNYEDNSGFYSVAIGIPEPANWAMMLGGFGVLGGALRRRRAGAVAVTA